MLTTLLTILLAASPADSSADVIIERVTTVVPFPRGIAAVDGKMYVLARGRVRDSGGVSAAINDRAGTIFLIDSEIGQPVGETEVSDTVRNNGEVFAAPTEPPFRLWRRESDPPESDRETDRPYCTLRFHEPTQSFYICGFSGLDLAGGEGKPSFSKNCSDTILRFDLRTQRWHEVERHHLHAGGNYPHHDPKHAPPPHGWLNGPDNIFPVGNHLYAAAKDNSLLVRYDIAPLFENLGAGHPHGEVVFDHRIYVDGLGVQEYFGHSALAERDGWLYVGYRTSSVIVRLRLNDDGTPAQPIIVQLVAKFDPYDPVTRQSANLTDMCFDSKGRLYVISANGGSVHRFTPDPRNVYDGRSGTAEPWLHLGQRTGNPKMKCENVFVDDQDRLFITSGDGYGYQAGADGTVYRVTGL